MSPRTRTLRDPDSPPDTFPDEVEGFLTLAEDCSLTLAQAGERMRGSSSSLSGCTRSPQRAWPESE